MNVTVLTKLLSLLIEPGKTKGAKIKLRAERKAGELIPGQITVGTKYHPVILSDLKITPNQSSNWQRIAEIPKELFEIIPTYSLILSILTL